jgi:hypothetical protein
VYWYSGPQLDRAPIVDSNRTTLRGYWNLGGGYNRTFAAIPLANKYYTSCVACKIEHSFEKSTFLMLRGLDSSSAFDRWGFYVPRFKDGFIMYYSLYDTVIEYDVSKTKWVMYISYDPTIIAESSATYGSLVIGNHEWKISNVSKTLTLTSCSFEQYTCNDGLCIDINLR